MRLEILLGGMIPLEPEAEMGEPLSSYLLERIKELDEPGDDEDPKEFKETLRIVDTITRWLVESRVALTDRVAQRSMEAAMLPDNRQMVANMFDDHYTRLLLKNVGEYVKRTMRLAPLLVKSVPSSEVKLYLEEAGRSYVFGHWLSSIALARAALETSLRECIQSAGVTPDRELWALIDTAGKLRLIDGHHQHLAGEIQRNGNDIIHAVPKKLPKAETSFDTLVALRGVLLYLYKDAEA